MKFQLFALATATSLACAATAFAGTTVNTNVNPIKQIDINTSVLNKGSKVQSGSQSVDALSTQNAVNNSPMVGKSYRPNVIVNTNVTPVTQVEVNTAVLSKDVTLGGNQTANVQSGQSGLVKSRGADGAYIYNYDYTRVGQYQYNTSIYSSGVNQGGSQKVNTNIGQIAGKK